VTAKDVGTTARGERVLTWCTGTAPDTWPTEWALAACRLFEGQTGELYTPTSLGMLPVPTWAGNLMLVEHGPDEDISMLTSERLRGLLWSTPFQATDLRIVAFALDGPVQRKGLGSKGWRLAMQAGRTHGLTATRLEVKADNHDAIRFYERRGLSIAQELRGYYRDGLGLLMTGPLLVDVGEA